MTKTRETKIEAEVIGYRTHRYLPNRHTISVCISGQGPRGRLSAIADVDGREVDLRGDGRYSAMHGNASLYFSDPIAEEIRKVAKAKANEWVAANPNGLYEHKVRCAEAAVSEWESNVQRLEMQIDAAKTALRKAIEERDALKLETVGPQA